MRISTLWTSARVFNRFKSLNKSTKINHRLMQRGVFIFLIICAYCRIVIWALMLQIVFKVMYSIKWIHVRGVPPWGPGCTNRATSVVIWLVKIPWLNLRRRTLPGTPESASSSTSSQVSSRCQSTPPAVYRVYTRLYTLSPHFQCVAEYSNGILQRF